MTCEPMAPLSHMLTEVDCELFALDCGWVVRCSGDEGVMGVVVGSGGAITETQLET